jgi:hypothetical protein
MADFILGMKAKLYHGAVDAALSAMTEQSNVKDLTLTMEAGEADVSTRANQGWKATAPTLRECTAEFEMVWKPGDTGFEAIKDAFLNATEISMAVMSEDKATVGSEGPRGNWSITNFSRDEKLEEAITVKVTAKLAKFIAWEKIAA